MNFQQRVQLYYDDLSVSEKFLINYIENNYSKIANVSIVSLSELANVSTSTIVRSMKKLGYNGFTDFKYQIVNEDQNKFYEPLRQLENINSQIKSAIIKNQEEVNNTINYLNNTIIEDAISAIKFSKKITIFARGFSEHIANEMTIKLQLLNKHTEEHTDPNIIIMKSKSFNQDDLVIFISLNGETEELVTSAEICKKNNIKTICITTNKESRLYNLCDIILLGYISRESYIKGYEVRSRLPLQILSRILLDAYVIRNEQK
ncbi:MurR/RpiR family transcriptional regulator [Staphylococcus simulans]|uniref:MurR/RpiR family transcriptional regulator n=1 Tax=Staphylococcus simulans TaxID=1286 RepID=UPI000E6890B6|nr:MurR/RpiR family transcriptional regulator [Staphylococcus simulans]RIN43327.1 MurR/RpiR family transcriptional regulator [Staphylococcus simulans]